MSAPYGILRGRPVQVKVGRSSRNNLQVGVRFALTDHPGEHLVWYGSFANEKAINVTMRALTACGWEGNDPAEFDGGFFPPGFGKEVELDYRNEFDEHEQKWKNVVKWVNAPGGGIAMRNALSGEELTAHAAEVRGALMDWRNRNGNKQTPAGEDPIPF